MKRTIIRIDTDACNGCGACARACHEGAIGMRNGKAVLLREDYCDGLGDCLPACPTGAITFEEREAPAYNEAAVLENKRKQAAAAGAHPHAGGCPGSRMMQFRRNEAAPSAPAETPSGSALGQWPVQIKLVPIRAPFWEQADILIAADCTAYAYAGFHAKFMAGKTTVIGCPKLDQVDYAEKLTEILRQNSIASVTVIRMEVPCCGGLEHAARTAVAQSGKAIPFQVAVISTDGRILSE